MSIFKKKIKNTFDVAREVGVDESKIKELKEGDRHITGETMDKVLQSINKSQVERDVEKFNIFEWYKNTDLKALRKEFGYKNATEVAEAIGIYNSSVSRVENKKYNNVNKAIIKLYDFYHDDFNKKVEKDEVQIPTKKEEPLSCSKTKREEIMEWYSGVDIMALRGEYSQKEISSLVGIPQPSWCALEKQPAIRCTRNIIKLYDYFHKDITAKDENHVEHNSEEVKTDEKDIIAESQNINNSEDLIFDGLVETGNLTTCDDRDKKDLIELSKYADELKNRVEEQNKEIDRLTRQVHCYEKLIDRL